MKLSHVLEGLNYEVLSGGTDIDINNIQYDSRKVSKGDVFIAIKGFKTDGHNYISSAVSNGAAAVILEDYPSEILSGITVIKSLDTRYALALVSYNFYDKPSSKMNVIGVTGTNGKTTTTYLIKTILEKQGRKTGIIGTIGNMIGDKKFHAERTTPESLELMELFSDMQKEGVSDVIMEVSSHSLDLKRVAFCDFDIGVFTNLTQDHLDYHKTMEAYKEAKSMLFEMAKAAVVNIDDEAALYMLEKASGKTLTFGIDNDANLRACDITIESTGVNFTLMYNDKKYDVSLNIPGKFSIYNALGAMAVCVLMDVPMKTIIEGLKENTGAPGRFQTIPAKNGISVIIDYAHTPDGLLNILNTAREFAKAKIITVFGCGGDRDKTKRPIMGEISGNISDYAIITSDNPRTEDPLKILDDVEVGMAKTNCKYEKIADRREAIKRAVSIAEKDDIIIIAGKGHEDYQIFTDRTIHFDDVETAKEILKEGGFL
ncbi:MAG: UDP-N-acetylmuramoyl-L-alanyl-D-glutamate--2,6-diaminopimelate ligase [Lachnospiraceae bacterium]|nr:UDP-N-acetylmuramoyl-L-alanyl-D-glutamate--2,6-diaminopimelate ligase [Lachnospiraceae bacterium]